jgi:hypothetical protein
VASVSSELSETENDKFRNNRDKRKWAEFYITRRGAQIISADSGDN